jgi:hypothetical protein
MSAFATLALQNNAGTTVNFAPLTIDSASGVASYGTSDAVYDQKSVVTASVKYPSKSSTKARLRLKVTVPLMDTVDTTKKVDEAIGTVELAFPKNMSSTDRLNLRKYVQTLVADAVTTAFATSFEGIY